MRRLLILVCVMFLSSILYAQEMSSHEKAAENMLELTNTKDVMAQTLETMLESQLQANPQLIPVKGAMEAFFQKHISYESIKDELIAIYVETFTEEELYAITEFYKTPVGQKLIKEQPDLVTKGMQIGQQRVLDNRTELEMMVINALAEQAAADSAAAASQMEEEK